jgi:branched-chain amino acid transport system permease protein
MFAGVDASLLASQAFTGLGLGVIFVLLAVGLSLIFGLMGVVNFAHGALYMLGAYFTYSLLAATGNFWIAVAGGALSVAVLGVLIESGLLRPLAGRSPDDPLLLTFGLSLVLVEAVRLIWGKAGLALNTPASLAGAVDLGFMIYPEYRLFVIGATVVALIGLWLFLTRTNVGLIIRAGTRDPLMVRALGFNFNVLRTFVFALGAGLAGLAGALVGPMGGVYAEMGINIVVECFVVVVVGGMGSLLGAVLAGLLIGEVMSFTTLFAPKFSHLSVFIVMAIVLILRPSGLFGESGMME